MQCMPGGQAEHLDYAVRGELWDWKIRDYFYQSTTDGSGGLRGRPTEIVTWVLRRPVL